MKILTSKLVGRALDWAVRYAELGKAPKDYVEARDNFSTCWNKGGPIIERENISCIWDGEWYAYSRDTPEGDRNPDASGPTPLIAAMRCYVTSKLGDEVGVPEELI